MSSVVIDDPSKVSPPSKRKQVAPLVVDADAVLASDQASAARRLIGGMRRSSPLAARWSIASLRIATDLMFAKPEHAFR